MTTPILYYDERSPPARSVSMLFYLLGIPVELKIIDLFNREHLQPSFGKLNPAHTVPVLHVPEEELILTDSHVILMYLAEKYQKDKLILWPKDIKERLKVSNALYYEACVLFRTDSDLMSEIVRDTYANARLEFHRNKVHKNYQTCETFLNRHKYFATNSMTIADLSAVTTITTMDLMFPIVKETYPRLSDWLSSMKQLRAYALNQQGLLKLKESMEKLGKFKFPSAAAEEGSDEES